MKSFLSSRLLIGLTVVGILVIGIVLGITNARPEPEDSTVTVNLKWVHQAQFAGMYLAKEKGWYDRVGLTVSLDEYQFGGSVIDNVMSGDYDFGITSANDLLVAQDEGADLVALAAVYQASPYVVVSQRGSLITTPRELKGKRLGVKGGLDAEGAAIFKLLLKSAGLTEDDVEIVYLDFSTDEKDDLLNGVVDAVGMYRTRLYLFEQEGINYNAIYPERYGTPVYNDIIFTTRDYFNSNQNTSIMFIDSTMQGWEYAVDHQEEAISATMEYVTNPLYQDRAYQQYILSSSVPLIKPVEDQKIGEMKPLNWQRLKSALVDRGVISPDLMVEPIVVTDIF